ncbi:MAG: hypothetical protein HN353_13640 [Bdellovibrionales bacterium]|jgi:hypothetical protein|nr:hypothetical protein [Bdellovibrionales bacterium]MBT3524864.1 hypothetical protein [Bdellovibrionales bacterium]MBT7669556.1 hypothetical protein [Bdellovibrionales bacterium]
MFTFIKHLWHRLWDRPNIQTFTYYIPAPPPRQTGYREKEFDQLFYNFINRGYHIISVNTETHHSQDHSGMWVIFTVKNCSCHTEDLKMDDDFSIYKNDQEKFDQVEGFYPLNE